MMLTMRLTPEPGDLFAPASLDHMIGWPVSLLNGATGDVRMGVVIEVAVSSDGSYAEVTASAIEIHLPPMADPPSPSMGPFG